MPETRPETIVDRQYREHLALLQHLQDTKQLSLYVFADDHFRRVMVLSAASYFEHAITQTVREFVSTVAEGQEWVVGFVQSKGIKRQYHTYFKWEDNQNGNANQFFAMFGPACKEQHLADVKDSPELRDSVAAFIELGLTRNTLVHENFAAFMIDKTAAEIYERYKTALLFVDYIDSMFQKAAAKRAP